MPQCSAPLWLESLSCWRCDTAVMIDPVAARPLRLTDDSTHHPCARRDLACNWAVPHKAQAASCYACRLIRRRPDPDDFVALATLADTQQSQRRLLVDLAALGLPVVPYRVREGGLAFDLLSSTSGQGPVGIGHADGLITINLA